MHTIAQALSRGVLRPWILAGVGVALIAGSFPTPVAADMVLTGPPGLPDFVRGGDISLLTKLESCGQMYKDAGIVRPVLDIFHDYGLNVMRLRLWVNSSPTDVFANDLPNTIALGKRIKQAGFKLLLDVHYSDTLADVAPRTNTLAWKNRENLLNEHVYSESKKAIRAMRTAGVLPDMVEVGNKISHSVLSPGGQIPVGGWQNFPALISAGIQGVDDGAKPATAPIIMIHIDRGKDSAGTQQFFDELVQRQVHFDIIGQSYYPRVHGPISALKATLKAMVFRYEKPVVVVETAFPFEGASDPDLPYPATPAGQRQFLIDVISAVKTAPYHAGRGVIWWEPEWLSI